MEYAAQRWWMSGGRKAWPTKTRANETRTAATRRAGEREGEKQASAESARLSRARRAELRESKRERRGEQRLNSERGSKQRLGALVQKARSQWRALPTVVRRNARFEPDRYRLPLACPPLALQAGLRSRLPLASQLRRCRGKFFKSSARARQRDARFARPARWRPLRCV